MNRARLFAVYKMPLLLMTVIIVLDQWTKKWAVGALAKPGGLYHDKLGWANSPIRDGHVQIFDSWFWLRYAENRAAAFSLTQSIPEWFRMPMLITVSILAVAGVLWWLWKLGTDHPLLRVALGLVLGGAIGNLIDRVTLGYVIDFIDWHLRGYNAAWTFPTFNIADSAVVCGGALILIFGGKAEEKTASIAPGEDDSDPPSEDEAFTEGAT